MTNSLSQKTYLQVATDLLDLHDSFSYLEDDYQAAVNNVAVALEASRLAMPSEVTNETAIALLAVALQQAGFGFDRGAGEVFVTGTGERIATSEIVQPWQDVAALLLSIAADHAEKLNYDELLKPAGPALWKALMDIDAAYERTIRLPIPSEVQQAIIRARAVMGNCGLL